MKKTLFAALALALALAVSAHAQSQDAKPTWELGKNPIDPGSIHGKINLVNGVVAFDGQNSFAIPAAALGTQKDYMIEFEVECDPGEALASDGLLFMSNVSEAEKVGLGLDYALGRGVHPGQ